MRCVMVWCCLEGARVCGCGVRACLPPPASLTPTARLGMLRIVGAVQAELLQGITTTVKAAVTAAVSEHVVWQVRHDLAKIAAALPTPDTLTSPALAATAGALALALHAAAACQQCRP